ncbi:ABC transporter ATP-binding protein [Paludicola sp. MB14-C6]|uniref:ABC transporter ATP-binding protein n=1 Tax=Paludihabitans sp. MB14-C6 TaxID=3070656 RepID=UPI0027DDF90B|nr:ABC transporter ATP-binding protein [Paludicola sp. MB14-C6]WMJ21799.1 ABC transporter ATP-binding protein [Paludicola sp. MB14-C6]
MSIIQICNITKKFDTVVALNNVTLTLEENKIYGLLGRNGAGKSTLLNLMTNKLFPTEGSITVDGDNVTENDKTLSKIFCMSEQMLYPDGMKISEVFRWTKEFYPDFDLEYAQNLSKQFQLSPSKKIKSLSTGYKSIFKLVLALSCNAPILLLDEPVLGLDANHRDLFYKLLIQTYSERPCTIVISTHIIEEISDLIEQVILIKNGAILFDKPTEELLAMGYAVSGKATAVDEYIKEKQVLSIDTLGGLKTAYLIGDNKTQQIPTELEVSSLNLQKLFIQLTNDERGEI